MYGTRQKITEIAYNNYLKVKQRCEAHRDNFYWVLLTYEEVMEFLFGKTQVKYISHLLIIYIVLIVSGGKNR